MREETNSDIFPKHFFWGASTSGHQVEGRSHNNWSVWELEHAHELAQTAHQRLSWLPSWERVKDQAEEPENYVSGTGVDHYNRYKEDFALIKKLNLNAFRFTIEWARLEPEQGKWDTAEIEHYKRYITELRKQKIEPFLNVWHWTHPVWFEEMGGFEKKENIKYFEKFVEKIAQELLENVEYVITLNETNNYVSFGYMSGEWPPGKRNKLWLMFKTYRHLALAHRRAYKILKKHRPAVQIGIAQNLVNIQPKRPHNVFDLMSTQVMRNVWNWWFLNRIKRQQDFIGVNNYFSDYYQGFGKRVNPKVPLNDLGWYMEPEGIYPLLLRVWTRFKKPIFITENGLADSQDEYRRWWLEQTIVAMERAISDGVDLRGYLHWSLLDNFEWAYGWFPKFGLVEVDIRTKKRKPRPSALWFAEWLSHNR